MGGEAIEAFDVATLLRRWGVETLLLDIEGAERAVPDEFEPRHREVVVAARPNWNR
ncbi:MAG: hypothetical protein ACREA0_11995 [bacterium]